MQFSSTALKYTVFYLVLMCLTFCSTGLAGSSRPQGALRPPGSLRMHYRFGFNHTVRVNAWAPLSVTLENRGDSVTGMVEALVFQGSDYEKNRYQTIHAAVADLPAGSRKTFHLTVPIGSALDPVVVRFRSGQRTLLAREHVWRGSALHDPLVLSVGRTASVDGSTAVSDPGDLPVTWYGYDGVARMVMDPAILPRLDDRQIGALAAWIRAGGYLVVSGTANYGFFSDPRIRSLLGIRISGLEKIPLPDVLAGLAESLAVPALFESENREMAGSEGDFWVNRADMPGAEILARAGGIPLMFLKQRGEGRILFLAFDTNQAGFRRRAVPSSFWHRIAGFGPGQARFPALPADDRVLIRMLDQPPETLPGYAWILPGLVLYLVLVSRILKGMVDLPASAGLASLVLSILLFSGAGAAVFQFRTDNQTRISILRIQGDRSMARLDTYAGIFSPEAMEKQLRFAGDPAPVSVLFADSQDRSVYRPMTMIREEDATLLTIPLKPWSCFFVRSHAYIRSGFRSRERRHNGGAALTLENLSDISLSGCRLFWQGRDYFLGDFIPDSALTLEMTADPATRTGSRVPGDLEGVASGPDTSGPGIYAPISDGAAWIARALAGELAPRSPGAPMVTGWGKWAGRSCLVIWELPGRTG